MSGLHGAQLVVDGIHIIHSWDVADAAARLALSVASTDVGKVARQLSDNTFWILTDHTGPTWVEITGAGGGGGQTNTVDADLAPTYGAVASTVCEGNDARLSDARVPTGAAGGELAGTYPNPTVIDGADGSAIHDDTAGEIAAVTLKGTPVAADVLLIEDSAAANAKKRITVGSLPTGGGGEANTASNVGAGGVGIFKQKTGIDLEFKTVNAGSSKISITDDAVNDEVDVDVVEANLDVANIGGTRAGVDSSAIHDNVAGEIAAVALKGTPVAADVLLIEDSAAADAKKRITIGSLPGGAATVNTGNELCVDAVNGNDGTAVSGMISRG